MSAYIFIIGALVLCLGSSFAFFTMNLLFIRGFPSRGNRRIVCSISFVILCFSLVFLIDGSGRDFVGLLVDRVEVSSVSYEPKNGQVSFVRDGKTFQLAESECKIVVVSKDQLFNYTLPYYEQEQEESRDTITIFGHKFYSDPQIKIKYIFYVTEEFLENLDYEIERSFLING